MSSTSTDRRAAGESHSLFNNFCFPTYSVTIQDDPVQDVPSPYHSAPLTPPPVYQPSSSTDNLTTSTYQTPNPSPNPSLVHLLNSVSPTTMLPPPTYQPSSSTSYLAASTHQAHSSAGLFNSIPATIILTPPPSAQQRRMSQFSILPSPHQDEEAAQQRPSSRPSFQLPLRLLETLKRLYTAIKSFIMNFSFLGDREWWKGLAKVFCRIFWLLMFVACGVLIVMLMGMIVSIAFRGVFDKEGKDEDSAALLKLAMATGAMGGKGGKRGKF